MLCFRLPFQFNGNCFRSETVHVIRPARVKVRVNQTSHNPKEIKTMTKKHFIALADMLRTARMGESGKSGFNPFKQEHIDFLADFCESQNPNFNRERWLGYKMKAFAPVVTVCGTARSTIQPVN
jgi:hypothetical protein